MPLLYLVGKGVDSNTDVFPITRCLTSLDELQSSFDRIIRVPVSSTVARDSVLRSDGRIGESHAVQQPNNVIVLNGKEAYAKYCKSNGHGSNTSRAHYNASSRTLVCYLDSAQQQEDDILRIIRHEVSHPRKQRTKNQPA